MNAIIGRLELTLKRIEHDHPDRAAIDVAYHSAKDPSGLDSFVLRKAFGVR
jgi:hypothetical protein